ncbi:hypothetical protein UMC2_13861 [[Clostridium] sordellii]|uniref:hypothetical protein n=1 Tax=Paraclostridium sordellii TaxID=1505 RepID=UPI0005423474|nr:hypothetical protein [Paeniclostridium sordellii]CEK34136.1 hypothetical protein UMC2_13861 [[Clostridium] sordellii] [Paeniclostridium sordellii]
MLKTSKTITINGNSVIDGQIVVYMNASLSTDGSSNENINKNIQNQELYANNKEAVRKDMRDFEDLVFAEQDKLSKSEI